VSAGQKTDMRRGAIAACALPMGLGSISMVFVLIQPTYYGPLSFLAFSICFLVVAPISAWLACRHLKRQTNAKRLSNWRTSFFAGLRASSLVQFIITGLCVVVFGVTVIMDGAGSGNLLNDLGFVIGLPLIYTGMIWLFITLPLSLICSTIFWRVTKFPKDTSVF